MADSNGFAVRNGDLYAIQWVEPAPGYEAEGGLIAELHPVEAPFLCPTCERPTERFMAADLLDERL